MCLLRAIEMFLLCFCVRFCQQVCQVSFNFISTGGLSWKIHNFSESFLAWIKKNTTSHQWNNFEYLQQFITKVKYPLKCSSPMKIKNNDAKRTNETFAKQKRFYIEYYSKHSLYFTCSDSKSHCRVFNGFVIGFSFTL